MCRRLRKSSSMVDPLPWWIRSARQVERNPFGNVGSSSMVDPLGKTRSRGGCACDDEKSCSREVSEKTLSTKMEIVLVPGGSYFAL